MKWQSITPRSLAIVLCALTAWAQPTGTGTATVITRAVLAASCSSAHVTTAIAAATAGDTVIVPAGTCEWASAVTIDKGITLLGATTTSRNASTYEVTPTDVTIIQRYGFTVTATTGVRITGFTFDGNVASPAAAVITLPTAPVGMRVDHNHFTNVQRVLNKGGGGGYLNVVFDHNRVTQPTEETLYIAGNGNTSWSDAGACGDANPERVTWLEDNEFLLATADLGNPIDMGEGARVVIRHNRFSGTSSYDWVANVIEAHGHCFGQRDGLDNAGMYCLEVSHNLFANPGAAGFVGQNLLKTRGGINYVYGNTETGIGWSGPDVSFWTQEVATDCDGCAVAGHATYHTVPLAGDWLCASYPCPMQVNNSYAWSNVDTASGAFLVDELENIDYAQRNRDWWDDVGGANFTKDVAASRPGTCTAQDSYWATDTRVLSRCTATNTWTRIYGAYAYPHPLTQ